MSPVCQVADGAFLFQLIIGVTFTLFTYTKLDQNQNNECTRGIY